MEWYKLVFKQNQPIHIGGLKWGVLNETLLFIPGSTMWGALTNAYLLENNPGNKEELEEIKEYFKYITCFYPCFDENGEKILFPEFKDGKFYLSDFSEEEFRFYFTDSLVRTAIDPIGKGAKEKALYEVEFILPKPKKEFLKQVNGFIDNLYWVGIVGISSEQANNFLKKGLKVYVGGDIRYGLGKLELVKKDQIHSEELKKWDLDEEGRLCLNNEKNLVNFLKFDKNIKFEGKLVLIPELEFSENLPKVEDAKFFISPGSKINEGINNKEKYIIKKGKFVYNGGSNEERD